MALEGIVSKRTDAPYRSGPSRTWLKSKKPGERGGAA
jgi:ATP-dependent DNA ligase